MNVTEFVNLQQLLQLAREYWWIPLCPAGAMFLLTPLMRWLVSAFAIGAVIWAIRYGRKKKPVIIDAEVVKEAA